MLGATLCCPIFNLARALQLFLICFQTDRQLTRSRSATRFFQTCWVSFAASHSLQKLQAYLNSSKSSTARTCIWPVTVSLQVCGCSC